MFDALHSREVDWIVRLQQFTGLDGLMNWLSELGPSPYLLGLVGLIYIAWDRMLGTRLLVAYFTGQICGHFAKLLCHEPRPYWFDARVHGIESNTASYGFPSGHALVAMIIWLLLAQATRRAWAWVVAVIIILLVSLSRVYLGVHFISDVAGGWLIGGIITWLVLRVEPTLTARWSAWSGGRQIALAVIISLGVFVAGILARAALAGTPDLAAWSQYTPAARSLQRLGAYSGALLGLGIGLTLMWRRARFAADGGWRARLLRLVLLAAPAAVYWLRPRGMLRELPELTATVIFYIASAWAAWAFTFAAPWLFLKMGLAQPAVASLSSPPNHQRNTDSPAL